MEQLALLIAVLVDVVRPGRALITVENRGGEIVRDGSSYLVEDDQEKSVGRVRSYRDGALMLAEHYGHPRAGVTVEIDHEWKRHSGSSR